MIALLHAHSYKGAGEGVNIVPEFRICSCVVKLGVSERVLVRELLAHSVEHVREGVVNKSFLGPDVLSGFSVVVLKRVFVMNMIRSHEVGEMRNDNTCVAELV